MIEFLVLLSLPVIAFVFGRRHARPSRPRPMSAATSGSDARSAPPSTFTEPLGHPLLARALALWNGPQDEVTSPLMLLEKGCEAAVDAGLQIGTYGAYHPSRVTLRVGGDVAVLGKRRQAHLQQHCRRYLLDNPPDVGWAETTPVSVRVIVDDQLPPDQVLYDYDYDLPSSLDDVDPREQRASAARLHVDQDNIRPSSSDLSRSLPAQRDFLADQAAERDAHRAAEPAAGSVTGSPMTGGMPGTAVLATQDLVPETDSLSPQPTADSVAPAQLVSAGKPAVALLTARATTAGRTEDNDVVIEHPHVSSKHLRLEPGVQWTVTDVGSKNGTELNGTDLPKHKAVALADGDVLRLANGPVLTFHVGLA